jgi:hypothetical protein
MHVESITITNPVEQEAKFAEIHVEGEWLDTMDESTRDIKKEIWNFKPTVQDEYVQL